MTRHTASLVALLLLTGACLPAPLARRPATRPAAPVAVPSGPSTVGPWIVPAATAPQVLSLVTRAVVTITGEPAVRVDTLQASLDARYAQFPGNRSRFDGRVTGYTVTIGTGTPTPVPGFTLPARFSAELGVPDAGFRLPLESTLCSDPTLSVAQALYDAWVVPPDTLSLGMAWSDTIRTVSCRDRIPLRGTVVRRFRVLGAEVEAGRVVVTVERQGRTSFAGEGAQFGETVSLEGRGEGALRYALDPTTGRWLRASGTATVNMSFKSKQRDQKVKQESALTLRWSP